MSLRSLPSVDQLLQVSGPLVAAFGRPLTLTALRTVLDEARVEIRAGQEGVSNESILARSEAYLFEWTRPTLQALINATGVILHTNLGRAPLSESALRAMDDVSRGYSNLEFDLEHGKRGSRLLHAEAILQKISGAEAALVVNNCASAILLALSALARRKAVIISRSQLVEIGGGFRIPDVMKQSGARLVEIGATNKVNIGDYEEALSANEPGALVMHVHRSNFKLVGFTEEPELEAIARVAHRHDLLFVDDLGSGALLDTSRYGMQHEPTVQESLAAGADLVMFSGDKLLGGPQAGIMVGRRELVTMIKKHPLARVLRADKTCLAGLSATLLHYLKDEAAREIPIWRMISMSIDEVQGRAEAWQRNLGCGSVLVSASTVGGGSLPGEIFPTRVLALTVKSPDRFLARLRDQHPPIIARAENDQVLLDPRTVLPGQDQALISGLKASLEK